MSFNPIKESTDGKKAHAVIWSTSVMEKAIKGIEQGKKLVANPFYEKNVKLMKGDLVFEKTEHEKREWLKCRDDIIYFANKYCKLMTPQGIQHITLRDYQEDYLRHLEKNRLSIFLSCRQSAKCNFFTTNVLIKIKDEAKNEVADILKKNSWKNYCIDKDTYKLPLFEIYNLYNKTLRWKVTYMLYKIIYRIENAERCKKERRSVAEH